VKDWLGEKRGEGRWKIEVSKPYVTEPKLSDKIREFVIRVGELRRIRLPEL
jgi:hypothetical protein